MKIFLLTLLSLFAPFSWSDVYQCIDSKTEYLSVQFLYDGASVVLDSFEVERYKLGRYLNQVDSKLGIQNDGDWLKKGKVDSSTARALNNARNRAKALNMASDLNQAYKNGAKPTEQNRVEAVQKFNRVFKDWQRAIDKWKKMDAKLIQANRNWDKKKANCL